MNNSKKKQTKQERSKIRKRYIIILILVLLLMGVTVGYSVLSTSLTITGVTKIKSTKVWDVYFENIQVTNGSVPETIKPYMNKEKTTITYAAEFSKPGDFYEFTVNVRNGGSIDAKVSDVPSITVAEEDMFLKQSFTHSDDSPIVLGEVIKVGAYKKYKVRVEFDESIVASQIPTEKQTITFTVNIPFEQV